MDKVRCWRLCVASSVIAALAGCGGGGSGGAGTSPINPVVPKSFNYGVVSAQAMVGSPQTTVTNSSVGPVITGVAGAAFTSLSVTPTPSVANTQIAYSYGGDLYLMNADGSNQHRVFGVQSSYSNSLHASWSRDGRLVMGMFLNSPHSALYICNRDGTNLHLISQGGFRDSNPSWSPDNTRIAFERVDSSNYSQVYVSWADGSGAKRLSDGTGPDVYPSWSPDSKTIYFVRNGGAIYAVPSVGGTATLFDTTGTFDGQLSESPDGTRWVWSTYPSGQQYEYLVFKLAGTITNLPFTSGEYDYDGTWSPDSHTFLYNKYLAGTGATSIMETDERLANAFQLATNAQDPSWEPFMGTVPMVAATGTPLLGTAASGFLFGLNNSAITSFVTFTCKTPTSATLKADPVSSSASNIIYHLSGDALTNISFVNVIASKPVSMLSATNTAKGAIVAFNAWTGNVALTLPYTKARPHPGTPQAGKITYDADFVGVWDSHGLNLAPRGLTKFPSMRSRPSSWPFDDFKFFGRRIDPYHESRETLDMFRFNKRHSGPFTHAFQVLAIGSILVAVGCGGAGGPSGSTTGPVGAGAPKKFNYGVVTAQALAGTPQAPVSNSSFGPVITGVAGAAFTNISVSPVPALSNSQIAYSYGGELYEMNWDGTNPHRVNGVTSNLPIDIHPSWSRDGRIVCSLVPAGSNVPKLYICNRDGSNLHPVSQGGFRDTYPSWSPDNTRLAFMRLDSSNHEQIYVSWADGSGSKRLSDGTTDDSNPSWSPDSKTILFVKGSSGQVYTVPSVGGTAVKFDFSNFADDYPLEAPDASRYVWGQFPSGNAYEYLEVSWNGVQYGLPFTNGEFDVPGSFSPDGQYFLYTKSLASGNSVMETGGDLRSLTGAYQLVGNAQDPSWEPFMGTVPMVAATGTPLMGTAASGFIFGLNGNLITSFVTFACKTPTSATLTSDPVSQGASNIIYHLSGDALTRISYVNVISATPTSLLSATSTAKGAIVAFGAATGNVALTLPYTKMRPHPVAPKAGVVTYDADFTGAWDGQGKNLAPSGAHEATFDSRTGKLLSIR